VSRTRDDARRVDVKLISGNNMPVRAKPSNLKLDFRSANAHHAPFRAFPAIHFNHRRGDSGVIIGDAYHTLSLFETGTFRCCVTSPPYWGLRDYGIVGQIGAEMELSLYLDNLTEIFREVRRVLRDDGTLWLNIGDSYTSGGRTWRQSDKKNPARGMDYRAPTPPGLKPKDLIGIPWKIAFALQADGWYLRSDIIWNKPNCQPESVKDRPTRAHEYVFLFSKSEHYFYQADAIKEPATSPNGNGGLRNRRSVWSVNTEAFSEAHFATFPPSLVRPAILAGTEATDFVLDPFLGSGTVGQVALEEDRRFVGIEIKPEYAELAVRRLGW
jgi:site-specific DNA-methyltransferase (adenine-specific)/site-specific DNA-methyltransferase (cytosine-N4-specific)